MKKIISMIMALAMLLSAAAMNAYAENTLPEAADGTFNIAFFGVNNQNYHTNANLWMQKAAEELGVPAANTKSFGSFNMANAWLNVGAMLDYEPELVLIDAVYTSNAYGLTDPKFLESILLSLGSLKNPPSVAIVKSVNQALATDAAAFVDNIAPLYGIDLIDLTQSGVTADDFETVDEKVKAKESAITKEGAYVAENLSFNTIQFKEESERLSQNSTLVNPHNLYSGTLAAGDIVRFNSHGKYLFMKFDNSVNTDESQITLKIDGVQKDVFQKAFMSGVGKYYSDLADTDHFIEIISAGPAKIDGVYSDPAFGTGAFYGFEDGKNPCTINNTSVVENVSDTSKYAFQGTSADAVFPVIRTNEGKVYNVSAKIKTTTTEAISVILYQYRQNDDGTVNVGASGYTNNQNIAVTPGEWTTINTRFTVGNRANVVGQGLQPVQTEYAWIVFRVGDSVWYADDISITEEETTGYFDRAYADFDDNTTGSFTTPVSLASKLSYVDDEKGGKALQMTITGSDGPLNASNFLAMPNTIYKISYRIKAADDAAVGKSVSFIFDRRNFHTDENGDTVTGTTFGNYNWSPLCPAITSEWQDVVLYMPQSAGGAASITSEFGWCNVYARFTENDQANTSLANDTTIKVLMDDIVIEPIEGVPFGACTDIGQIPAKGSNDVSVSLANVAGMNGEQVSAHKVDFPAVDSSKSTYDIFYKLPVLKGEKYRLSFKYKGTDGTKLLPIVNWGKWWLNCSQSAPASDSWQKYSYEFTYLPYEKSTTNLLTQVYPYMMVRPLVNAGTYYIYDINIEKISSDKVSNISNYGDITEGGYSNFTFSGIENVKGYSYDIYALDANNKKIVLTSGITTKEYAHYPVYASAGTKLYADIKAIDDNNQIKSSVSAYLGEVLGDNKFAISLDLEPDEDVTVFDSIINVKNDNEAKKIISAIALYDKNYRLLSCEYSVTDVAANETKQIPLSAMVAEEFGEELRYARAFAWDENMKPLCDYIEFK